MFTINCRKNVLTAGTTIEWDSLKDVPFRGEQQKEAEEDEMEMGI